MHGLTIIIEACHTIAWENSFLIDNEEATGAIAFNLVGPFIGYRSGPSGLLMTQRVASIEPSKYFGPQKSGPNQVLSPSLS